MTTRWNQVTIIGCGLIGASFALALRRAGACARIAGWDASASVLDEAVRTGVIDEVDQAFMDQACASERVSSSDLIYLAMPVGEIIEFLRARARHIKRGAVITDAGSTKVEICRAARLHLISAQQFVGGHPVAGSHLQGLAHARSDLFAGAPYVLVTDGDQDEGHTHTALKETLDLLGACVTYMTAVEHDRVMAFVSHLPQIVSSALAAVTTDQPDAEALIKLSGAGYRDMTRLASSSWLIWADILATNSTETVAALEALVGKLTAVRDELRACSERVGVELTITRRLFGESGPA
ncbi:MAG TPA: prephenate dehydrogenase/arogenate dehydrogenase family protein [Blastocatellia bacterium]|nr:prephenate dehydrogenase/arogenate dehydrogenase family protein [Blastocatellia bacterium]